MRQSPFEAPQAPLAHVAEAGVVRAALGVVVVGDDGGAQAGGRAEEVEPVEPAGLLADLVHLVHGDRDDADRERRGARHREDAARAARRQLRREGIGDRAAGPLAERIAGAPRAGHDIARLADAGEGGGEGHGVDLAGAVRGDGHRPADARREELDRAAAQLVGVLLEAVRSVQDRCRDGGRVRGRGAAWRGRAFSARGLEALEEGAVDLRHRRRGLARAHDREDARPAHASHPLAALTRGSLRGPAEPSRRQARPDAGRGRRGRR